MNIKELRKLAVLLLLITMLVFSPDLVYAISYSDTQDEPYKKAVETLSDMGIIGGYSDGTYQPSKSVTRAEFSAMIAKYLGASDATLASYKTTAFKDMRGYGWSIPYVSYCSEKGIITGDGKGNAMPGNTITYAQAITMIVRALGLESELNSSLKWPTNYIEVAVKHGMTDNVTASGGNINRGNAALLLYNSLHSYTAYSGNLAVSKLSLYQIADGKLVDTYRFARNLDTDIYVSFTLEHDILDGDKVLPVELIISPTVEKKVIEQETKSIKLLANTTNTDVTTSISIKDLVKDNYNVNQYKLEIKANNTILDVDTLELYIDTSKEEEFIKNSSLRSIKFYSGNNEKWIEYGNREYALNFLKTPVLSVIGTEETIQHAPVEKDMTIPVRFYYTYKGYDFCDHTPDYYVTKGSTETRFDFQVYYGQFQAKKYQTGNYTVKVYAFDKLIAEGKLNVVDQ